jgi:hypothetical protein
MQDLILKPVRVATSKPAQQTYLNTILFMTTSAILLGFAVFAYILFYFNYVPQIGIERIIHLQYGYGCLSCLLRNMQMLTARSQRWTSSIRHSIPRPLNCLPAALRYLPIPPCSSLSTESRPGKFHALPLPPLIELQISPPTSHTSCD